MTDASTIQDYEALQHEASQAGFDVRLQWLGDVYGISLFGRKENGYTGSSPATIFHTIKEARAWVMGYWFRRFERQDFDNGVKK